jgi:hypothetical protein
MNISKEECEIIIDSLLFNKTNNNIKNKVNEEIPLASEIDYFTESGDLTFFSEIIERNNKKLKEVDESFPIKFRQWKSDNLFNLIKNINYEKYRSGDKSYLLKLLEKNSFFNNTLEYRLRKEIKNIINKEEVIGYITYYNEWNNKEQNHEYEHSHGLLFTKEKIYKFTTYIVEKNIECIDFDSPFLSYSANWLDGFKNSLNKIDFFNESNFSFVNEIANSKLSLNTIKFEDALSKSNLGIIEIKNLMTISNYIDRYIDEFNLNLTTIEQTKPGVKNPKYLLNNLSYISELFQYILNSISHISTLLIFRDQLFYYYKTNDLVNSQKLYYILEDKGVFQNKFQRDLLENLDNINNTLLKVNNNLIQGFESLNGNLNNIFNSIQDVSEGINKINSNLKIGNFIKMISTYQLYKINKSKNYFK